MNLFNIEQSFRQFKERNWNTLYVVVDLHGTLVKPDHNKVEFYPGALEVMRWFNLRKDFRTILWSSSFPNEIEHFLLEAEKQGIRFDFVNQNPLELNSKRADFSKKFYFNILLDDKAGFVPETDWGFIKAELIRLGEWNKDGTIH